VVDTEGDNLASIVDAGGPAAVDVWVRSRLASEPRNLGYDLLCVTRLGFPWDTADVDRPRRATGCAPTGIGRRWRRWRATYDALASELQMAHRA
jgi:hypothetical protein